MLKKYIEPEIKVLEITEHVFCNGSGGDSSDANNSLNPTSDEGEVVFVSSDEHAESVSPATDTAPEPAPEPAPAEEAPVEAEPAETE